MTITRTHPAPWTDGVDTITGAQIAAIDTNITLAIDGTNGGTYSPAAPVIIGNSGLRMSGTDNVQLTSRSITRTMPLLAAQQHAATNWTYVINSGFVNTPAAGAFEIDLVWLPHGQTLASITVVYEGGAGHAAFPAGAPGTRPTVALVKTSVDGVVSVLHTTTDASATANEFEGKHNLVITHAEVIDRASRYSIVVTSEQDANYLTGDTVWGLSATVTCTSMVEW